MWYTHSLSFMSSDDGDGDGDDQGSGGGGGGDKFLARCGNVIWSCIDFPSLVCQPCLCLSSLKPNKNSFFTHTRQGKKMLNK